MSDGRWDARQQAMLREIGLRLWLPPGGADQAAEPTVAAPPAALPAPERASAPGAAEAGPALLAPSAGLPVTMPATAPLSKLMARPAPADAASARMPSAAADVVAAMDWPALRSAVASCQACQLCESRTQTVFGIGHPQAHWMIVGEAPGEQEDLRGEPFVGAAGRLLDRMLLALGLTRGEADGARQVFIANTLKCRPPRNRNPEPDELLKCQPFLERQVELVQPRVILAMGRFAIQSLLQTDEPVGRLRGRVHPWRGRPLVVTYHPAYLLRSPTDKSRAWADLCLAAVAAERFVSPP